MDDNSTGVFDGKAPAVALPAVLGSKNESESTAPRSLHYVRNAALSNNACHFDSAGNEPEWTTNLERLIVLYRDKCAQRILVHREAATYYNRRLKLFSVPGAILGAVGSSTVFVTWKSESCQEQWHEITLLLSGVCMLVSTALGALVAQSQYQALFASHLKSYRNFDKMLKKLTVELCFERQYRQNVRDFIESMLRDYDHLVDEAELVPASVEKKIRQSLFVQDDEDVDLGEDGRSGRSDDESSAKLDAMENGEIEMQDDDNDLENVGGDSRRGTETMDEREKEDTNWRRTTVSALMQARDNTLRHSGRKSKDRSDGASNNNQRRKSVLDGNPAVSKRMPLTSMGNIDSFAFPSLRGQEVESRKKRPEKVGVGLDLVQASKVRFIGELAHSSRSQKSQQSAEGEMEAENNKEKGLPQPRVKFAQTKRLSHHEGSHQTLVDAIAAQGIDNLAKSHEHSRSSQSAQSSPQSSPMHRTAGSSRETTPAAEEHRTEISLFSHNSERETVSEQSTNSEDYTTTEAIDNN